MKYKVTLNGRTYEVEVEAGKAMLLDEYEAIAPAAPATAPAAAPAPVAAPSAAPAASLAAGEPVKAPMPGVVLKVQVQQGQAVKAGQVLVILEAMKMENEIVAPKDGTVAQIVAAKGASVESGAPLVILA
ncbi:MAG: biotin/lipoyl-containing protein [Oscillospiraceae bacterium]|jgi:biotin carboxyl carrier protein|nr:MAG: acetyl-CoA carboxylase biotin carboxyl carrier protein subunit [Firmicutes bacterium CAG:137_57_8]CDB30624.1 biotin/lipoyl attachment domain-containing protein [Firmicutes bacterium CAG:137]